MPNDDEDKRSYKVVVNHEEQYSIWFADRDNAPGWRDVGKAGSKAECLAFIEDAWDDMRPLSLRAKMAEEVNRPKAESLPAPAAPDPSGIDGLVRRLGEPQEVEVAVLPRGEAKALKDAVDRGFVFMVFQRTGTKLGITLDRAACDLSRADFDSGTGSAAFVGDLVLNYNKIRYHGDIDLKTLRGTGRLEFVRAVTPAEAT
jgi:uncharacterized protein YbdZ (MbtH family)